jgi:hypothetical protein
MPRIFAALLIRKMHKSWNGFAANVDGIHFCKRYYQTVLAFINHPS